jgi:programmed cell death 6-interacting protein
MLVDAVPPKSELKPLERASMVSSKAPNELSTSALTLGDHSELGQPLFAKLVPYAVHVAASIYAERRDRLINTSIISELEILTSRLHEYVVQIEGSPLILH